MYIQKHNESGYVNSSPLLFSSLSLAPWKVTLVQCGRYSRRKESSSPGHMTKQYVHCISPSSPNTGCEVQSGLHSPTDMIHLKVVMSFGGINNSCPQEANWKPNSSRGMPGDVTSNENQCTHICSTLGTSVCSSTLGTSVYSSTLGIKN